MDNTLDSQDTGISESEMDTNDVTDNEEIEDDEGWEDQDIDIESIREQARIEAEKEAKRKYLPQVNKAKAEAERLKKSWAIDIESLVEQKMYEKEKEKEVKSTYWDETWNQIKAYRQKAPWLSIEDASKIVLFDKVQDRPANTRATSIWWRTPWWIRQQKTINEVSKDDLLKGIYAELQAQGIDARF